MVLRRRWVVTLAVAMMLTASARSAHASIDLNSSMTASCQNAACGVIRFVLSIPNQVVNGTSYTNVLVDRITINALRPVFAFGSVLGVWNSTSSLIPGSWSASINTYGTVDVAFTGGALASVPIYLDIAMASSDPTQLFNGSLTYTANGHTGMPVSPQNHFSTGGQVTPEPISMIMLGTGLLGVAGARRRRKNQLESAV